MSQSLCLGDELKIETFEKNDKPLPEFKSDTICMAVENANDCVTVQLNGPWLKRRTDYEK